MNDSSAYSAEPKKIVKDFMDDSPENEEAEINQTAEFNKEKEDFEENVKKENERLSYSNINVDSEGFESRKNLRPSKRDIRPNSIDFNFQSFDYGNQSNTSHSNENSHREISKFGNLSISENEEHEIEGEQNEKENSNNILKKDKSALDPNAKKFLEIVKNNFNVFSLPLSDEKISKENNYDKNNSKLLSSILLKKFDYEFLEKFSNIKKPLKILENLKNLKDNSKITSSDYEIKEVIILKKIQKEFLRNFSVKKDFKLNNLKLTDFTVNEILENKKFKINKDLINFQVENFQSAGNNKNIKSSLENLHRINTRNFPNNTNNNNEEIFNELQKIQNEKIRKIEENKELERKKYIIKASKKKEIFNSNKNKFPIDLEGNKPAAIKNLKSFDINFNDTLKSNKIKDLDINSKSLLINEKIPNDNIASLLKEFLIKEKNKKNKLPKRIMMENKIYLNEENFKIKNLDLNQHLNSSQNLHINKSLINSNSKSDSSKYNKFNENSNDLKKINNSKDNENLAQILIEKEKEEKEQKIKKLKEERRKNIIKKDSRSISNSKRLIKNIPQTDINMIKIPTFSISSFDLDINESKESKDFKQTGKEMNNLMENLKENEGKENDNYDKHQDLIEKIGEINKRKREEAERNLIREKELEKESKKSKNLVLSKSLEIKKTLINLDFSSIFEQRNIYLKISTNHFINVFTSEENKIRYKELTNIINKTNNYQEYCENIELRDKLLEKNNKEYYPKVAEIKSKLKKSTKEIFNSKKVEPELIKELCKETRVPKYSIKSLIFNKPLSNNSDYELDLKVNEPSINELEIPPVIKSKKNYFKLNQINTKLPQINFEINKNEELFLHNNSNINFVYKISQNKVKNYRENKLQEYSHIMYEKPDLDLEENSRIMQFINEIKQKEIEKKQNDLNNQNDQNDNNNEIKIPNENLENSNKALMIKKFKNLYANKSSKINEFITKSNNFTQNEDIINLINQKSNLKINFEKIDNKSLNALQKLRNKPNELYTDIPKKITRIYADKYSFIDFLTKNKQNINDLKIFSNKFHFSNTQIKYFIYMRNLYEKLSEINFIANEPNGIKVIEFLKKESNPDLYSNDIYQTFKKIANILETNSALVDPGILEYLNHCAKFVCRKRKEINEFKENLYIVYLNFSKVKNLQKENKEIFEKLQDYKSQFQIAKKNFEEKKENLNKLRKDKTKEKYRDFKIYLEGYKKNFDEEINNYLPKIFEVRDSIIIKKAQIKYLNECGNLLEKLNKRDKEFKEKMRNDNYDKIQNEEKDDEFLRNDLAELKNIFDKYKNSSNNARENIKKEFEEFIKNNTEKIEKLLRRKAANKKIKTSNNMLNIDLQNIFQPDLNFYAYQQNNIQTKLKHLKIRNNQLEENKKIKEKTFNDKKKYLTETLDKDREEYLLEHEKRIQRNRNIIDIFLDSIIVICLCLIGIKFYYMGMMPNTIKMK